MKAQFYILAGIALFLCVMSGANASPITYHAMINTSSISGAAGSLDFQFNPGPLLAQDASVQILNFSSDGSLIGGALPFGSVTGDLTSNLTINNSGAYNDYFQDFTFGSTLAFDISLDGAALRAPDNASTSGSSFAFSMFSDQNGTQPFLTADAIFGSAFDINVNTDGSTALTNFSSVTSVTQQGASSVPEPNSLSLMLLGLAGFGLNVKRKKAANSGADQ